MIKPLFLILSMWSVLNLTYMLLKICFWVIDGLGRKSYSIDENVSVDQWCEILLKLILPYWRYWWIKYYEVSIYLLNQVIRPRFSLSLLPTRNRKKNNLKMICRGLSILFDTVYFPNLFVVSGQVVHSWVKISSC